jgi:E3 ubiquitin-protein ligase SHPRH
LVYNWRAKIIELLKSPIEAESDLPAPSEGQEVEDPEKEYYAQALKAQGEGKLTALPYNKHRM